MKYNKGSLSIIAIVTIIAVLGIGAGSFYYVNKVKNDNKEVEVDNMFDGNYVPPIEDGINTDLNNNDNKNENDSSKKTEEKANINTTSINTNCNSNTPPYIKVLSPNGGELYTKGEKITINWTSCNVPSSSEVFVALHQNGDWQNVINLTNSTINSGSQTLIIPQNVIMGKYKVRIGSSSASIKQDFSDNYFTIKDSKQSNVNQNCFISPSSLSNWNFGEIETIKLSNPPKYGSHCMNGFSLHNANTNTLVGYLNVEPRTGENPNQNSWNIALPEVIPYLSCGTGIGDDPSTVSAILPGKYKIKFYEYDTENGQGSFSCESPVFNIN